VNTVVVVEKPVEQSDLLANIFLDAADEDGRDWTRLLFVLQASV